MIRPGWARRTSPRVPGARAPGLDALPPLLFLLFAVSGVPVAGTPDSVSDPHLSRTTRPNVLLITVDTLRADALGWVDGRRSTPAIDALARDGFRFPAAVTPAPLTQPAHASLLTGLLPRHHGVRANGRVLGQQTTSLTEILAQEGYATGAFVSGYPLNAIFGFDQGFDHFDDTLPDGVPGRPERGAEATTEAAIQWLRGIESPWFLWIHYYDAHDPYEPPDRFRRPGARGAYDGEVAYIDHEVGRLRAALGGRPDHLVTILTADHGESLGEHGEQTHGFFLYESVMRVPLVLHWPTRIAAGTSDDAARLHDVLPTLLELLGLSPVAGLDGVSLVRHLRGDLDFTMPVAHMESQRPWLSYGWAPLSAVRDARWKLIRAPRPELYDLTRDPGETTNRIAEHRREARRLEKALQAIEAAPARDATTATASALETLRALGYVDAGQRRAPATRLDALADPKDKVGVWNALSNALAAAEQGRIDQALRGFDAVLEQEPDNPFALARSGAVLLTQGAFERAFSRFERALTVVPEDNETRQILAVALQRNGQFDKASTHWMELARRQPRRIEAWVNLATCLGRSGRAREALEALERAVEIAPERDDLRQRLEQVQALPRGR